jgi:hypothetical protein
VGKRITDAEAQFVNLAPLSDFSFSWDAGKLSPRAHRDQPLSIERMVNEALGPRIPKSHPCDSSAGVRLIRARLMSQVIEHQHWFISDRCPKLIAAIPEMIRDPKDPESMLKLDHNDATIGDDPVDSAGLGLQWMVGTAVKPDEVILGEKLQAVRQKFAARQEEALPGVDPFAAFGGQQIRGKQRPSA